MFFFVIIRIIFDIVANRHLCGYLKIHWFQSKSKFNHVLFVSFYLICCISSKPTVIIHVMMNSAHIYVGFSDMIDHTTLIQKSSPKSHTVFIVTAVSWYSMKIILWSGVWIVNCFEPFQEVSTVYFNSFLLVNAYSNLGEWIWRYAIVIETFTRIKCMIVSNWTATPQSFVIYNIRQFGLQMFVFLELSLWSYRIWLHHQIEISVERRHYHYRVNVGITFILKFSIFYKNTVFKLAKFALCPDNITILWLFAC